MHMSHDELLLRKLVGALQVLHERRLARLRNKKKMLCFCWPPRPGTAPWSPKIAPCTLNRGPQVGAICLGEMQKNIKSNLCGPQKSRRVPQQLL